MPEEGIVEGITTGDKPEGTGEPAWLAQLPTDLKANEAFTGFKTIGDFSQSYLELKGKAAEADGKLQSAIFKPSENATPEEILAYRTAIGVPEKPADYEFPKEDGVEHSPEMLKWARETFHNIGLSKDQAAGVSKAWDTLIGAIETQQAEDAEKTLADVKEKLKTEWGANYDTNYTLSERAFNTLSKISTPLAEYTVDPVLVKTFYEIGKIMGEDSYLQSHQSGSEKEKIGLTYPNSPAPPKKE